jgi:hypothetical protein
MGDEFFLDCGFGVYLGFFCGYSSESFEVKLGIN